MLLSECMVSILPPRLYRFQIFPIWHSNSHTFPCWFYTKKSKLLCRQFNHLFCHFSIAIVALCPMRCEYHSIVWRFRSFCSFRHVNHPFYKNSGETHSISCQFPLNRTLRCFFCKVGQTDDRWKTWPVSRASKNVRYLKFPLLYLPCSPLQVPYFWQKCKKGKTHRSEAALLQQ